MIKKTIRDKIKTILTADGSFTTVEGGRENPFPDSKLPAVTVAFSNEDIDPLTTGVPRRLRHAAEYLITVHQKAATEQALEESLDTLEAAVRDAITADDTLTTTVKDILPVRVVYEMEKRKAVYGTAEITFLVVYYTTENQ